MKGTSVLPIASYLFQVCDNPDPKMLSEEDKEEFHHLTAKLLYLSKHTRPDIQTALLVLCT